MLQKKAVLETHNKYKGQFENMEPVLLNATKDKKWESTRIL